REAAVAVVAPQLEGLERALDQIGAAVSIEVGDLDALVRLADLGAQGVGAERSAADVIAAAHESRQAGHAACRIPAEAAGGGGGGAPAAPASAVVALSARLDDVVAASAQRPLGQRLAARRPQQQRRHCEKNPSEREPVKHVRSLRKTSEWRIEWMIP